MAKQPDRYPTEVIFIDNDGVRCPAKIVGYDDEGNLPPIKEGELRIPAKDAELELKTCGVAMTDDGAKESKTPVTIQEYRICETKSGAKDQQGKEIVGIRPMVDLMVNRGTTKTGPKWNFVSGISHAKHINGRHQRTGKLGSVTNAKRHFVECEQVKIEAPKTEVKK